jgi:Arc/MetJ-type ribon-helix-helix transcriptional regulator
VKSEQESKAVLLSAGLYGRLEERVKDTGFGSVDEYVTFILEEVLKDEGEEEESALSKEDEEEVKKRLKALGYLD